MIVGEKALDAERHVLQASGGVQSRADGEAQVVGGGLAGGAPGHFEECRDSGARLARANARQALRDQDAVVGIELHHVGDGAQRHQVEELREVGLGAGRAERAAPAQFRAQLHHHVEDHAHAGQVLARESAARLVRVHDALGVGNLRARQMMIGHQHAHAEAVGLRDALDRGDAVVHRDEDVGSARHRLAHDLRG